MKKNRSLITVVVKEPCKEPVFRDIPNTLEAFQEAVGGYIETDHIFSDLVIICNEEGLLRGLPYNCQIMGADFVGTILFLGVRRSLSGVDHFASIPMNQKEFDWFYQSATENRRLS